MANEGSANEGMTEAGLVNQDLLVKGRIRPSTWLGKGLLILWLVLCLIGISSLALGHMVAMPAPSDEARLSRALLSLRRQPERPLLVHVISAGCSCTRRLMDHLLARGPLPEAEEVLLYVGSDPGKQRAAEARGFAWQSLTSEELTQRYGLEAAPVLIGFDAAGALSYAGGYYDHPSAITPLDLRIYAELRAGRPPEGLPVFGCAVSPRLQQAVDPLGVVYSQSDQP